MPAIHDRTQPIRISLRRALRALLSRRPVRFGKRLRYVFMGSSVYIMYVRDGQLDMRFFYGPLTSISISMFLTYNNFVWKVCKVLFMADDAGGGQNAWLARFCQNCRGLNGETCVALKSFTF